MSICFFNFRQLGSLNILVDPTCAPNVDQEFEYFFSLNLRASTVIGMACHDCAPAAYQYISQKLYQHCVDRKIQLIIVADVFYQSLNMNWPPVNVHYVDYWPMLVERHAATKQHDYNVNADQILCLTGTMDRINRVGIVAAFFKAELIDKIRYSWMLPDQKINPVAFENAKKICAYVGVNLDQLILHSETAIKDTAEHMLDTDQTLHKIFKLKEKQFNLDPAVWQYTKLSLVNETIFENHSHFSITEKTWMAIYNYHPFFILNHPGANQYMNQLGIQTIDSGIDSEFDQLPLDLLKLNRAISISTRVLNQPAYNTHLESMVQENFQVMFQKIKNSKQILSKLANQLCIALENIQEHLLEPWAQEPVWRNFTVHTVGADEAWQGFYNNIKDPSWPQCDTQAEFELLPRWIQQEILSLHSPT